MVGFSRRYFGDDKSIEVLVGKYEERRALCRLRCRGNGNIKIELQEIGLGNAVRISVAQDREKMRAAVNTVMNFRVP